ncbi:MAG: acyl-CoA dehydrogenase family protein [Trueperaceae bacterium]|nr:acyl-CoA dehydrogenase family protein [Trueperaceae bacterium]
MNFELPDDLKDLRRHVRDFARERIETVAAGLDAEPTFPRATLAEMGRMGLMGVSTPESYGGAGLGTLAFTVAIEEISAADASHGTLMAVTNGLPQKMLVAYGSEAQKEAYLPKLASGAWFGAFCLSEAQAGSDAAAIRTRASAVPDGYRLRGAKAWVTGGGEADLYLVLAVTDPEAGARGISAFLVPGDAPGLSFGTPERKMGQHAAVTTTVTLDDVFVSDGDRLGGEGEGFVMAMASLDGGRIGIAAQSVGIARAAFEASRDYADEREAFGRSIRAFQGVGFPLAEMATRLEAARLLTQKAAWAMDRGFRVTQEASMAKLFASETAGFVTDAALQVFGGAGYTRDHPVERYLRDARVTRIYEGTSEIQRMVIVRQIYRDRERRGRT